MNLSQFIIRFKLFGIPVVIYPGFWILALICSPFFTLRTDENRPWLFGVAGWFLATLASLLIHEFGHALMARRLLGVKPEVMLGMGQTESGAVIFGGMTHWKKQGGVGGRAGALISFAGPGAGLTAVFLGLIVAYFTKTEFVVQEELGFVPTLLPLAWISGIMGKSALALFTGYFAYGFFWMNSFWSLFNLLPVFPLDGGQIIGSFCGSISSLRNVFYISIVVAILVGAFLFFHDHMLLGAFFFYLGYVNFRTAQALE